MTLKQHDYVIDNQTFPNTRSDINDVLQAIAHNNVGPNEPSTKFPYQYWYDETNNILKIRNADNDAWISLFTFNQTTDTAEVSAGGGAGFFQGENGNQGDTTNGKGDIFRTHEQELNTNTEIASGDNSGCFHSLSIASGVTLTVSGNLVIS